MADREQRKRRKNVVTMEDMREEEQRKEKQRKLKDKSPKKGSKVKVEVTTKKEQEFGESSSAADKSAEEEEQVLIVPEESMTAGEEGVTLIQVEDLAGLEGSILGQDISIQLATDKDAGGVAVATTEEDEDTEIGYQIQSPENYRREMLESFSKNLTEQGESYADIAVFCSDGIVWSNKFILAAASPMMKAILEDIGPVDDTCLIIPSLSREEFSAFHSALFSKSQARFGNMYGIIRGCEMIGVDIGMSTMAKMPDEPPLVEYMNILANPMTKKRVYKSLGYIGGGAGVGTDVPFSSGGADENGPEALMRILDSNLKCTECSRTFYDEASLDKHLRLMHSSYRIDQLVPSKKDNAYQCDYCTRTFAYAVNVKNHIWFCHSTTGGALKTKLKPMKFNLTIPQKTDLLEEKYEDMRCSICNFNCTGWKQLETHMMDHTNEIPFKCEYCDKGFKEEQKLQRHLVVHTKEKNFACDYCDKRFGLKHNMIVHMRKHRGYKMNCEYCSRVFTIPVAYRKHKKLHREAKHNKTEDPEIKEMQIIKMFKGRPRKRPVDENTVPVSNE